VGSDRRRRPFGEKLEIERDDAGVLGKLSVIERLPAPRGGAEDAVEDALKKGLKKAAVAAETSLHRTSARTQQWITLSAGAFATALAWFLALAFSGLRNGPIDTLVSAGGLLGPAAVAYGLALFLWPEPSPVPSSSDFGRAALDEARNHRLWIIRIAACILGIAHLLALWSFT
jgi:hypothetical protein